MKPNNNRPKDNPNNFFARNIRDKGEDFLDHMDMTNDQLQIQAIIVFRDMVKGKIDIPKYTRYFCDPRIISAFTIAANTKYQLYSISYNGISALIREYLRDGITVTPDIKNIENYYAACADAYAMILDAFNALSSTNNITILQNLVYNIRTKNYRYNV